jgi:hypothetical protein
MSHKLGICIPYRNRKEHIENLIPHLSKYLNEKGINHKFYVGHQIDDKLFNRGAMKNIAAHYAFEDGCDYIAWHDVDMLAEDKDGLICDYSYPETSPIHIATKLSKYNYGLGYDQYFGGVVLFTKEQSYQTNGYSNNYWDWGQEDDDLFWRCYFEGFSTGKVFKSYENKPVANFNGDDSLIVIPTNETISNCLSSNHTISVLFKADQQQEKVPIWLVGDEDKKFIEYPILRKHESWTWGLSFNNSRTVNMTVFDKKDNYHNNWAKKFEGEWTWVTVSFDKKTKNMYFYVNDELVTNMNGIKENIPFVVGKDLKKHDVTNPFILGFCSNQKTYYKGKIAEVKIFNKFFNNIESVFENEEDIVLDVVLGENNQVYERINNIICEQLNTEITTEDIDVIENIIPIRREGNFKCMFHNDEGFVDGKWAKGETTARNEKRFVTEMQQGKIKYEEDGLKQILEVLDVDNIYDNLYPNTKFINVRMK